MVRLTPADVADQNIYRRFAIADRDHADFTSLGMIAAKKADERAFFAEYRGSATSLEVLVARVWKGKREVVKLLFCPHEFQT